MPRPPNDNEPPRPARRPKRSRRTKAPRRIGSETLYIGDTPVPTELRPLAETVIQLTPLQFLHVLLKLELRDRVTEEELQRICNTYYSAVMHWGIWD